MGLGFSKGYVASRFWDVSVRISGFSAAGRA